LFNDVFDTVNTSKRNTMLFARGATLPTSIMLD